MTGKGHVFYGCFVDISVLVGPSQTDFYEEYAVFVRTLRTTWVFKFGIGFFHVLAFHFLKRKVHKVGHNVHKGKAFDCVLCANFFESFVVK